MKDSLRRLLCIKEGLDYEARRHISDPDYERNAWKEFPDDERVYSWNGDYYTDKTVEFFFLIYSRIGGFKSVKDLAKMSSIDTKTGEDWIRESTRTGKFPAHRKCVREKVIR